MAYTTMTNRAVGYTVTESDWDDITGNFDALNALGVVHLFPRSSGEVPVSGVQGAAYSVIQSSGAGTAKPQYPVLAFDKDTDEGRIWNFTMPRDYAGTLTVSGTYYTTATSGTLVFSAQLAAISDGDTSVTAKVFASANTMGAQTVPGSAGTEEAFTITMTNADSVAANDRCMLILFRDVSEDTAAADILLTRLDLFYNLS